MSMILGSNSADDETVDGKYWYNYFPALFEQWEANLKDKV